MRFDGKNKCSIIVPVYNVEKYLSKCIESLVGQTYENLEILLIDDGSTDSSGIICDEWGEKDSRIKVLHEENGGVSKARNRGLSLITGEYVLFVDSDDYIDSTMVEKLVVSCNHDNADCAMCKMNYIMPNGNVLKLNELFFDECNGDNICYYYTLSGKRIERDCIITDNIMGGVSRVLYRSSFIGQNKFVENILSEDLLFNVRLMNKDVKISKVNEYLYFYLQRENSLCHSFTDKNFNQQVAFTNLILKEIEDKISKNNLRAYKFQLYLILLNRLAQDKDKKPLLQFKKHPLCRQLNTKENYKDKQYITKGIKYKIANYCAYKKMFLFYRWCINLIRR